MQGSTIALRITPFRFFGGVILVDALFFAARSSPSYVLAPSSLVGRLLGPSLCVPTVTT